MWIRSKTQQTAPPDWAPPGTSVTQLNDGGTICSTHDTWGAEPPRAGWFDCGGGWEAALLDGETPPPRASEIDPGGVLRVKCVDGTSCAAVLVQDLHGRTWTVPVVLTQEGRPALQRQIVPGENGAPVRRATKQQQAILDAAEYLFELSGQYDGGGTIEADVQCIAIILAAGCHMSAEGLYAGGLLDDYLMIRVWLGAFGKVLDDGQTPAA